MNSILRLIGAVCALCALCFLLVAIDLTDTPEPTPTQNLITPTQRLEISVGGTVRYYKVPLNQVIHIITDENGNNVIIQFIPDEELKYPNGKQTNQTAASAEQQN